jgi:hypothetical protein
MINAHITRNGVEVRVMDTEAIESHFRNAAQALIDYKFIPIPNTDMYITTMLTFGDMTTFVLGDQSFDYALPQSFWYSCEDWRDYVWLYSAGDYVGKPFNVKAEFFKAIKDHHFIAQ